MVFDAMLTTFSGLDDDREDFTVVSFEFFDTSAIRLTQKVFSLNETFLLFLLVPSTFTFCSS